MADAPSLRPLTVGRGNRNEGTRRHNLSTLLALVHHHRQISRAELTRVTGLNRSTIGALVGDLVDAGLVVETAPATGTVGRPSPIVRPRSEVVTIAINPDVDATLVGIVGLGGVTLARTRVRSEEVPSVAETVRVVALAVEALLEELGTSIRVVGAGVAVPGLVQRDAGVVARAPHLLWERELVADALAAELGVPVAVDNDANIALVAETIYGAAADLTEVVYLNGSTSGIGGGVLVNGTLLRGADGFAGELGHTLVTADGEQCHCGRAGCLETEVNLQRLDAAAGPHGLDHARLDTELDGDLPPALAAEIDRQVDVLARAIASFVSVFNPQSVVLGGFLGTLYALRTERLEATMRALAFAPLADSLRIDRAQLRDDVLLVGAGELAFAPLLADPLGD